MNSQETPSRCLALTNAGEQCKNDAQPGAEYCHIHQPEAVPQPEATPQPEAVPQAESLPRESELELSDEEIRRRLVSQLDELTQRVQSLTPEYEPPPFSAQGVVSLIEEMLEKFPREMQLETLERLRSTLSTDVFDVDVWKGAWYMLNYTVKYNVDLVKRHYTGDYDTDEWGLDWEFLDAMRPFFTFLYKAYWRVETTGLENIPLDGRALLVANHSGQLPWDGSMVGTAVLTDHTSQRLVRTLYADWFARVPFLSSWLTRVGQVMATEENGTRLLEQDELVAVYPEGYKGMSKLYKDRYRLARFGRGGFVKMAMKTESPIIPVSVVGSEETYIVLKNSAIMTKATGWPSFPITPTFPWLGLLGLVPLPTKWYIDFGEPIQVNGHGPEADENLVLVSQLTDQVRNLVQDMVYDRLAQRRSVFF